MAAHPFKFLLVASAAVAMLLSPTGQSGLPGLAQAQAQSVVSVGRNTSGSERIMLGLDKSLVIDLPADAHDILVANPAVADAVSRTARRIYLFGKSVGETNIFVFDRNGEQLVSLDLRVERDVAGLDRYLERFIAGSDIKTEIINDNIVLTGTVQTPQDAAKAAQLAEIFVKGGDATTQETGFFFGRLGNSQIVNLLEITGGDQVTLKVTVAEIQRSVMKQLGTSLSVTGSSGDITFGVVNEGSYGAHGKPLNGNGLSLGGNFSGGGFGSVNLNAQFRAMEEAGVMKTLAEPTLTAVSGEKAIFRAGGEYNIVNGSSVDDDGRVIVNYRQIDYGVGLEFTPVVLSPGRISLQIRTSVSEPTSEGSVSGLAGNVSVLSLRKRLADTTVELPSGGSMMIAGLLRDDVRQVVSGFPGLSKVPVLGALFRSQDYIRAETELVIVVTPYLSRPVAASQLARPTDNFNPPSDAQAALLTRVNRIYGSQSQEPPPGRYHGAIGFIYK
ncbi:MAG: type II and III secretion system protein family protein [Roseitalea sp.]|jgi:pilus assembly protein CpaC|nr:type II and III secretion system protein family protein [Oceaniradius stylonematis]MBO6553412.1 type II and III secretion system protein family protein [Roseitalea sp.]MBO6952455.1 type II and III secretion system protein family protein [Rhizobiaceae bacterium]MBO6593059.1 type II and III secretion system protein family protein [Roseitalea sp.]MBO6600199.1 type II and III secretion system protein family protein [Roseitalea sp.]MBO6613796.1 type II and III secretion system protein family pro